MTQQSNTGDESRVQALDEFRPPETAQIESYDVFVDGEYEEHVTLDDPIMPDELPENAERASFMYSLDEYSDKHNFAVVHRRLNTDDEGVIDFEVSGTIRLLAPTFDFTEDQWWKTDDTFDTWQAAEAFIATHFEQPDADDEYILPMPAGHITMEIHQALQDNGSSLMMFFADNSPEDDAFTADAINPNQ